MAMNNEDESKSFSFKFSKSKKSSRLPLCSKSRTFQAKQDEVDDIDYVISTEGKEFKSVKPKKEKKKLVIPLINHQGNKEDEEAAKELLKDLKGDADAEKDSKTVAIPLLMRNKLPVKLSDTGDEALDVTLMPEVSNFDDYEDVPVNAFGAAMLRGMGWKEGEAIGLTNKGLSEPIEFIPRHKGLGLGAEKRQEEVKMRRRKLGDAKNDGPSGPIVEKDGKVRHFKGVGETVYKHPQGFSKGAYFLIEKGVHKGVYGKIIATDEDNARVTVKLSLTDQQITVSQYNISLVDEDEYRRNSAGKRKIEGNHYLTGETPSKKPAVSRDATNGYHDESQSWLASNIRVRIISKLFKRGIYYNKKVEVLDVTSRHRCTCRTDEGRLLDDVLQRDLETVIPKMENGLVMIVQGKYKGHIGKLIDREREKCRGHVQLVSNKHVTKLSYDSISEYLGSVGDDDFL